MRAIVIVLDSFGIGALPDAALYGDENSNTLQSCVLAGAKLTNMRHLGLFNIDGVTCGKPTNRPMARYARLKELSAGKDTTTGHWEMMGLVQDRPFPTFPNGFPAQVIAELEKRFNRPVLGNCVASGTEIIQRLGQEQLDRGGVIVYTSADSVLQIAAHTDIVPLDELYAMCNKARELMQGELGVGRIIARPFAGKAGEFYRRPERHDFSVTPPPTLLDSISKRGLATVSVGKICDIFAGRGIAESHPVAGNEACIKETFTVLEKRFDGLVFINLVDFDMLYGHRNDAEGYAKALDSFDAQIPALLATLLPDDLLIITADHGCDPSTPGTDHSREYVPALCVGNGIKRGNAGTLDCIGCVAATVAHWLGVPYELNGSSII